MYKVTITNIPVKYKAMNSVSMMVNIEALTPVAAEVDLHNGWLHQYNRSKQIL